MCEMCDVREKLTVMVDGSVVDVWGFLTTRESATVSEISQNLNLDVYKVAVCLALMWRQQVVNVVEDECVARCRKAGTIPTTEEMIREVTWQLTDEAWLLYPELKARFEVAQRKSTAKLN